MQLRILLEEKVGDLAQLMGKQVQELQFQVSGHRAVQEIAQRQQKEKFRFAFYFAKGDLKIFGVKKKRQKDKKRKSRIEKAVAVLR